MEEPIYLVDGSGYIFRAYYAIQPLSTNSGLPTNALLGFTRMLLKLLKDKNAEYLAVAFDTAAKTFRHEQYPEYKANRGECPEDLVPQMPYFRSIVKALGLSSLEMEGFEADDILATIAKKFGKDGQKVIIVSGDKDLAQLVNDDIQVWDAMRDVLFDPWMVKEKFGVEPSQIIDFLALTGDSSDNIPGVKGIGPKTAVALLENFRSVDGILENVDKIGELKGLRGAKSVQAKIESSVEMLRLSQKLVTLDSEVPPFNMLRDLDELHWKSPKRQDLESLFLELEFDSMAKAVLELRGESEEPCEQSPFEEKDYQLITNDKFDDFVTELANQKEFAFDTETTSLDIYDNQLVGISFSWQVNQAFYIPILSNQETENLVSIERIKENLSSIFSDPQIKKYGSNLKFDAHVLAAKGIEIDGIAFDTMLCAHILNPDKRDYGLKSLAASYLNERMTSYKEVLQDKESILEVDVEDLKNYACHDADASWGLFIELSKELDQAQEQGARSREVLQQIEFPLIPSLVTMERAGIEVDAADLKVLSEKFGVELESLKSQVFEIAGAEFNLNSPKQLSEVLFTNLGLSTKGIKKTKTGYSTNAQTLLKLQGEHEIVDAILEYRELHKLKSTYIDAFPELIHPRTGRIHASFNQAITATGRLSSSDPNLQNIPIRNPRGRKIRDAFKAKQGSLFVIADYSQIELRVLAHMSGDEALIEAFESGEDIHAKTARELFSDSDQDPKELRRMAKTINFGIIYGMSAFRFARDLGVSHYQAQKYIDDYFAKYPKVQKYFDSLRRSIEVEGCVETLFGRRRFVGEINTSGRDYGYTERSLLNAPIQGTAAEIIKMAMIRLSDKLAKYGEDARIVLQVHDELVIEVSEELQEEILPIVLSEMEGAVKLSVPLKVDSRVSKTWGGDN